METSQLIPLLFVLVVAIFLGFELISKVPSLLHTPLMSGSNAISGITVVGAILAAGLGDGLPLASFLGGIAVAFAVMNVAGGYLVTDRMLLMFKKKGAETDEKQAQAVGKNWLIYGSAGIAAFGLAMSQGWLADRSFWINMAYIASCSTFIMGFRLMSRPSTAKNGNIISGLGMVLAMVATLFFPEVVSMKWVLLGLVFGAATGGWLAFKTPMTGMPGMVGLLNGFGGLASLLVAWAEIEARPEQNLFGGVVVWLTAVVGAVTLSGSVVAWMKLEEKAISGRPISYRGQQFVSGAVILGILIFGIQFSQATAAPSSYTAFFVFSGLALLLGVLLTIPIGGADMPVVICLLNSYSGIAACLSGFVINNMVLVVAGALVGASGIILTLLMCKAMNRSVANVFLGGFGTPTNGPAAEISGEIKPLAGDEMYLILEAATNVVIVPGFGMAVSQAQHAVHELTKQLEKNGAEVRFAIHPVAGRMPGHMNVLLAEANIPYDAMVEMDDINPTMENVDVCLIIGANDVVNPAALEDKNSPLFGMPIIESHRARTVIVLKRSMGKGFAGVENPLFFKPNCRMLFGDAKASLTALVAEFKSAN